MDTNTNHSTKEDIQSLVTAGLSATSKEPFLTSFKITLGIGLARVLNFSVFVIVLILAHKYW